VSLILAALLVAGGAFCGGWVAKRISAEPKPDALPPAGGEPLPPAVANPFARFSVGLGDVIVAMDGEEAWLAGALLFYEEAPALALFVSPDSRAVLVRPAPEVELLWLSPAKGDALSFRGEPPSSIEHEGELYERVRRLPFRAEGHGTGAPEVGETVLIAEYKSALGGRLLSLSGDREPMAWTGRALGPGMYDHLPSGTR
jgi:hypothetical protein